MLVVSSFPCSSNILRGRLKHSWLENQLLNKTADEVVYLWKETGWGALDNEFSMRVSETITLAENLVQGFSPAQLVDSLAPLARLDQETRDLIKQAVHKAYLESSGITELSQPLCKAAKALEAALDQLRTVWRRPVTVANEKDLKNAWQMVSTQAKALHAVLERLPKGVVLP